MMANLNNTRVKIPNLTTPRADADSCKSHDELPPNLQGMGGEQDWLQCLQKEQLH